MWRLRTWRASLWRAARFVPSMGAMTDTCNLTDANNARINVGADYNLPITWYNPVAPDGDGTPVNLTGYTARMQIRRQLQSTTPLLELTDANNCIVFNADRATGQFTLVLTAAQTATLGNAIANAVYDLDLIAPSGFVTRLLEGAVEISPEVTR